MVRSVRFILIDSNHFLEVDGHLIADGVTFTSNAAFPAAGDWYGIKFSAASNYRASSLTDCTILYSQYGIYLQDTSSATDPVTISDCMISMNSHSGTSWPWNQAAAIPPSRM